MPQIVIVILISGLLPIVCAGLAKWGFKDYNNREPRTWLAAQEGWRARANAAQQNSFEIFPLFVAAVIFAVLAGSDASIISPLCWFFVAMRIIYIYFYLADKALLRTLVWILGQGVILRLFLFAMQEAQHQASALTLRAALIVSICRFSHSMKSMICTAPDEQKTNKLVPPETWLLYFIMVYI